MKFCMNHWTALREAIKVRGMSEFVALNGEQSMRQTIEEFRGVPKTRQNFDPLMACHWAIINNAMTTLAQMGQNPLILLASDLEHPELECPICRLNWLCAEHDKICHNPKCKLQKGLTFDKWINAAADEMAEVLKSLPPE